MAKGRERAARKRGAKTTGGGSSRAGGAKSRRGSGRERRRGKASRRENETLMTLLRNPQLSRAMQAGIEAAEEFHGQAPTRVSRLPGRGVFVEIGDADEILYSPSAGHRRGGWFHKFGKGAKVAVPVDDDGTLRRGELAVFFEGEFDPSRGIVG